MKRPESNPPPMMTKSESKPLAIVTKPEAKPPEEVKQERVSSKNVVPLLDLGFLNKEKQSIDVAEAPVP
jgi:hypothetical protein